MSLMYVAVKDETIRSNGTVQMVRAGVTLVSEDSDLYRDHPDLFELAKDQRGVEQATAAPGEYRNVNLEPEEEEQ